MRHLGGAAIGLVGALVGLVVMALGLAQTQSALVSFALGPGRVVGAALLLVGGALLGGVAVARRLSIAAPLTGGVLLVGVSAVELASPGSFLSFGSSDIAQGIALLVGFQLSIAFGALLLVSALGAGSARPVAMGPPPGAPAPYGARPPFPPQQPPQQFPPQQPPPFPPQNPPQQWGPGPGSQPGPPPVRRG